MLLQALEISKFSQGTTSCTIIDDLATEDKFATNIEYYSQSMFQLSILLSRKFSLIEHFRGLRVFRGSTPTARSAGALLRRVHGRISLSARREPRMQCGAIV